MKHCYNFWYVILQFYLCMFSSNWELQVFCTQKKVLIGTLLPTIFYLLSRSFIIWTKFRHSAPISTSNLNGYRHEFIPWVVACPVCNLLWNSVHLKSACPSCHFNFIIHLCAGITMPNSLSVLRERNLSGETRGMDYFDPLDLLAIKLIRNMGKTNTNW